MKKKWPVWVVLTVLGVLVTMAAGADGPIKMTNPHIGTSTTSCADADQKARRSALVEVVNDCGALNVCFLEAEKHIDCKLEDGIYSSAWKYRYSCIVNEGPAEE